MKGLFVAIVLCALAVPAAQAAPGSGATTDGRAAAAPAERAPNLYRLDGRRLHILYSTDGRRGRPTFSYRDGSRALLFIGDEIRTTGTEIGTLVTVTILLMPDRSATTFSLLVPHVNLGPSGEAAVKTIGITTVHDLPSVRTPPPGQTEHYSVTSLAGTARFVVF